MTRIRIATALAALLLVAGCTAAAEDNATKAATPAFGPGWRHEQMMLARQQSQLPSAMMAQRGPGWAAGPGMGFGGGPGMGFGGGPPRNPDGTVDTSRLPDGCPLKTSQQQ